MARAGQLKENIQHLKIMEVDHLTQTLTPFHLWQDKQTCGFQLLIMQQVLEMLLLFTADQITFSKTTKDRAIPLALQVRHSVATTITSLQVWVSAPHLACQKYRCSARINGTHRLRIRDGNKVQASQGARSLRSTPTRCLSAVPTLLQTRIKLARVVSS